LGVKVVVPTASQREQFVTATRAVYTKWKPQIGNNLVAKAEKTLANVK
jgi:TRAP-type C4-dicarboxylate transport system substrate-binding protein